MSLILDALKKLERERRSGEPGVVVVGHVPWGGTDSRRPLVVAAAAAVAAVLIVAIAAWWLLRPTRPSRPSLPPTTEAPLSTGKPSAAVTRPSTAAPAPPTRTAFSPPAVPSASTVLRESPSPREKAPAEPTAAAHAPSPSEEGTPAPPAPDLRLNAITIRDGRPIALVNDRLVREGDSFDGIRILRIGESEVEVEVRGQRRTIRF